MKKIIIALSLLPAIAAASIEKQETHTCTITTHALESETHRDGVFTKAYMRTINCGAGGYFTIKSK